MESISNLIVYTAPPIILAFVLLLVIFMAIFSAPALSKRRIKKLKKTLEKKINGRPSNDVVFYTQEDVAVARLRPRDAKTALLVFDDGATVDFFQASSSNSYIHLAFARDDTQIKLIDNSSYGSVLPTMVRLYSNHHSYYLYSQTKSGSSDTKATTELYKRIAASLATEGVDDIEIKSTHPLLYVALLSLVLLVGITLWAGWQDDSSYFPTTLAKSDNGTVVVASRHYLYVLGDEGQLKQKVSLLELGLVDGLSDIEYIGNDEWLFGDFAEGLIKKCNIQKKLCDALPDSKQGMFTRVFKFTADMPNGRIYVSDTAQHRLLALSITGELLTEIASEKDGVCFPNDPVLINNKIFVANTNHHEVMVWDVLSENYLLSERWLTVKQGRSDVDCPLPEQSEHLAFFARERLKRHGERAVAYEFSRSGRVWPIVLAQVDNHLWVINGGDDLAFGDILQFDERSNLNVRRIMFDETLDPVMMLQRKTDVLITDSEQGFVHRVAKDGKYLGIFGDKNFQDEILQMKKNREKMAALNSYGLYGLFVFITMLIMLLFIFRARRIRHIIEQDPAFLSPV